MFGAFARFARSIDEEDTRGRHLLACLSLASARGFADAASHGSTGSFTGHLTGNTLLAAIGIVERDGGRVLACSVAVASFVLGTAVGTAWPHEDAGSRLGRSLVPILAGLARRRGRGVRDGMLIPGVSRRSPTRRPGFFQSASARYCPASAIA